MYYRYKIKSKKKTPLKFLLILTIIAGIAYFGYDYRQYLMFWQYTDQKLQKQVSEIQDIENKDLKLRRLETVSQNVNSMIKNDPLNENLFFLSGKIHYFKGIQYLPGSFSEMVINDKLDKIPEKASSAFIEAIKSTNTGIAIMDRRVIDSRNIMILAKSLYYTGYYPHEDILEIIEPLAIRNEIKESEDIRFYALLKISGGNPDEGVDFLAEKTEKPLTLEDKLYIAVIEEKSGRHTRAIMTYRDLLAENPESSLKKHIQIRLGSIYYKQGLYKESIESYKTAMNIDNDDTQPKIGIGRNYIAMGEKEKAKAILTSILAQDSDNPEARALLNIM